MRYLLFTLLLLWGCKDLSGEAAAPSFRNGHEVIVKADGRQGTIIELYPSTKQQGQTEYLVKFLNPKPVRGQKYITEGFLYEELDKVE